MHSNESEKRHIAQPIPFSRASTASSLEEWRKGKKLILSTRTSSLVGRLAGNLLKVVTDRPGGEQKQ